MSRCDSRGTFWGKAPDTFAHSAQSFAVSPYIHRSMVTHSTPTHSQRSRPHTHAEEAHQEHMKWKHWAVKVYFSYIFTFFPPTTIPLCPLTTTTIHPSSLIMVSTHFCDFKHIQTQIQIHIYRHTYTDAHKQIHIARLKSDKVLHQWKQLKLLARCMDTQHSHKYHRRISRRCGCNTTHFEVVGSSHKMKVHLCTYKP